MRVGVLRVFLLSSTRVSTHRSSLPSGKRRWLYLSSRKVTNAAPRTTDLFRYCQQSVRYWNELCTNKLSDFLRSWLTSNHLGFKKSDGTVPQLVRMTQEWSNAVDEGEYVAAVFFDLKKAFDRVWHQGLFTKLRAAGIKGAAHKWLVNFLTDRVQVTVVNGTISTSARLFAGVPQGAILSPLLFSVYMNDIPFPRTTNLLADDTSSYIIDSVPSSLESKLQERTDLLSEWFFKWRLNVNPTKSAVMVFRSKKMQPVSIQITIDTHNVPQVSDHRHLGVTFSETLSWTRHTDNIVHAASTKIGLLRRLRKCLSPLIIRQLCLTCIRPSLEYANVAWCGLTKRDQGRLEKCNRSAARLITQTTPSSDIPHDILLARAGIPTLLSRRQVAQVKLAFTATRCLLPAHLQATFSSWTVPSSSHAMAQRNPCIRFTTPTERHPTEVSILLYFFLVELSSNRTTEINEHLFLAPFLYVLHCLTLGQ